MYRKQLVTLAAAAACGVGTLVGCGSAFAASSHARPASKLSALKAELTQAAKVPSFRAPGPAFNASKAKGKTIVSVPFNSEIPYCAGIQTDMQSIGKSIGVTVTGFTGSGQPSSWEAAANQAVSRNAGAFTTICGINPTDIAPQIAQLTAKKIPTVALLGDVSLPAPSTVTGVTSIQLVKAADILVDDAVVQNGGKPFDALILTDHDIFGADSPTNAAVKEMKTACGSQCSSTVLNIPAADWQSGISSQVSTALTRDPKITAVIALYDGMVTGMMPAITGAHRSSLHVYTYGASPGVVDLIKSTKGVVSADIGAGTSWSAYIQMDQVLRVMTGQKPVPVSAAYPSLRLWTPANASQINSKNPYGTSFVSGFKKLWGLG